MVISLEYILSDNNGNQAAIRFWLPDSITLSGINTAVSVLENAISAVSSARIDKANVVIIYDTTLNTVADISSNVYERLLLFFSNGVDFASISVPSPRQLPFDSTGPYRDIRLTMDSYVLSGLQSALDSVLPSLVRPDGSPFPTDFIVAGKTRY